MQLGAENAAATTTTSISIQCEFSGMQRPPDDNSLFGECADGQSAAPTQPTSQLWIPHGSSGELSSLCSSAVAPSNVHGYATALESSRPYPTRNKSLPDIDDLSATHVFAYMEHYQTDLFWSLFSDSSFIAGSIVYIIVSMWNFVSQGSVQTQGPMPNKWYVLLDVVAPLVYLLNSIVDIIGATHVQQRQTDKRKLTQYWEEMATSYTAIHQRGQENHSESSWTCRGVPCWCGKLRKHAAHRRTVGAALMFGIAVSLAVWAALIRASAVINGTLPIQGFSMDARLDMVSDYIWLVSAIVSLTGKRNRPWMAPGPVVLGTSIWNDPERLQDVGDLLFFMGCVLDAVLADARLTHVFCLAALSSVLWFLDGCLYLHSDIIKAAHLRQTQTNDMNVAIV
jgi:ABC-type multidrug transport system fused ATPase/permease subunit